MKRASNEIAPTSNTSICIDGNTYFIYHKSMTHILSLCLCGHMCLSNIYKCCKCAEVNYPCKICDMKR